MKNPKNRSNCNVWWWARSLAFSLMALSFFLHMLTFHRLAGIEQEMSLQQNILTPSLQQPQTLESLLELALKEQQALDDTSKVLVMSPLGNTTNQRQGYKEGRDDTFTLECSLVHHQYPHSLIRATFDDSAGYNSLDIRKVRVIQEASQKLLLEYPPTTLLVVVDAFDVLFQRTPQAFIDAYQKQPYPILVGGEPTCWDPATGSVQSNVSTPFCSLPNEQRKLRGQPPYYLNSGVYMATLGTLVRFLSLVLDQQPIPTAANGLASWPGTTNQFNDQAYWSYWYVKYHPLIGLDAGDLTLIANIGKDRRKRSRFVDGKFIIQSKEPAILHFPGQGAKDFRVYVSGKEYYQQACREQGDGVAARLVARKE